VSSLDCREQKPGRSPCCFLAKRGRAHAYRSTCKILTRYCWKSIAWWREDGASCPRHPFLATYTGKLHHHTRVAWKSDAIRGVFQLYGVAYESQAAASQSLSPSPTASSSLTWLEVPDLWPGGQSGPCNILVVAWKSETAFTLFCTLRQHFVSQDQRKDVCVCNIFVFGTNIIVIQRYNDCGPTQVPGPAAQCRVQMPRCQCCRSQRDWKGADATHTARSNGRKPSRRVLIVHIS